MSQKVKISVLLPKDLHSEFALRVPEGERSIFVRDAILNKLQKTPRPEKILELEKKIAKIENDISKIKMYLTDLEILTYEKGKVNPHKFCIDKIDHSIIDHLIHYSGATTSELAKNLGVNRWLILNRLKRIEKRSRNSLGKTIIEYFPGEKEGKMKAWWLKENYR
jgi:hypothetical protein